MKIIFIAAGFLLGTNFLFAQYSMNDSTTNNLVHTKTYKTSTYGDLPHYIKKGSGKIAMILIPGLGFDASVFSDFMAANEDKYTMYAVTVPGYGKTNAPAMPATDTSYGKQYWNTGLIKGIVKLIEKEKLKNPIIAGHFTQGVQAALRMAIDYPDKTGGIIIMGGPAKFIAIINGEPKEFPLAAAVNYVDNNTAPKWFKAMSKKCFDDGNYLPEVYSLDSATAINLWNQSAAVPLPVMIRYACEFFASDITLETDKIKCPVLVLRALFNEKVLQRPVNNYLVPQFIHSWDSVSKKNSLIQVRDIPNAASFIWKDNPEKVYSEITDFVRSF